MITTDSILSDTIACKLGFNPILVKLQLDGGYRSVPIDDVLTVLIII